MSKYEPVLASLKKLNRLQIIRLLYLFLPDSYLTPRDFWRLVKFKNKIITEAMKQLCCILSHIGATLSYKMATAYHCLNFDKET